jgi:hypothetical protein
VAVPPERDDGPVREFPSFTAYRNDLADWLKACTVDTVAMESSGVYWIPLFELLEARGFTALLALHSSAFPTANEDLNGRRRQSDGMTYYASVCYRHGFKSEKTCET